MSSIQGRWAGGVVVRLDRGAPEYLLVNARENPRELVLPKGHIDEGETPETAARREIREEAGVDAVPVAPLGVSRYDTPREHVEVEFFLFRYRAPLTSRELERTPRWYGFEEALRQLTFDEARTILHAAHALVHSRPDLLAARSSP